MWWILVRVFQSGRPQELNQSFDRGFHNSRTQVLSRNNILSQLCRSHGFASPRSANGALASGPGHCGNGAAAGSSVRRAASIPARSACRSVPDYAVVPRTPLVSVHRQSRKWCALAMAPGL